MRAGRINRRFTLQSPNPSRGAAGAIVEGWSTVATVWGGLETVGGRESLEAGKLTGEVTHRIIVRFRASVTNRMRLTMSDTSTSPATSRSFRILMVENPGDGRRELRLLVKEMPDGEPT